MATPAEDLLRVEAENIAKFGEPTPTPQTGPITPSDSLPAGYGTDLTGRIFRLTDEQVTSPVVTSDEASAEVDEADKQIDKAKDEFDVERQGAVKRGDLWVYPDGSYSYGDPRTGMAARYNADGTRWSGSTTDSQTDGSGSGSPSPDRPEGGLTPKEQLAFNRQRDLNDRFFRTLQLDIQAQVNRERQLAEEAQKQQTGMASRQLARMGALNVTTAGIQYLNDLQIRHQREVTEIVDRGQRAIERAAVAKSDADLKTLNQELEAIRQSREEIQRARNDYYNNLKKVEDLKKTWREDAALTISAMAKAGWTSDNAPKEFMDQLDKQARFASGTSMGLLDLAGQEEKMRLAKDLAEMQKASTEMQIKLQELLGKVPDGVPITIGDYTYYGRNRGEMTSYIEESESGLAMGVSFNKSTGAWEVSNLGYIGAQKDGYQVIYDGNGVPFKFNTRTGELRYAGISSAGDPGTQGANWESIIPTGSIGGQCGRFVNQLTGVGVGDSLESKMARMDQSIGTTENPIRVGDVVVQSIGGWTGHVAIVNSIIATPDGRTILKLTESNVNKDEKVTHSRQILADDSTVKGFARGTLDPMLQVGTDAPSFAPKVPTKAPTTVNVPGQGLFQWDPTTGAWKRAIAFEPDIKAPERVIFGGKTIVERQPDGTWKDVFSLPGEQSEEFEIRKVGDKFFRFNKKDPKEGVEIPLKDVTGKEVPLGGPGTFDAKSIAASIFSPGSNLTLKDVPTKDNQRAQVAAELDKLKSQAIQSGNILGVIRASAGGDRVSDEAAKGLQKASTVIGQLGNLQQTFRDDKRLLDAYKVDAKPIEAIWRSRNPYDTKAQQIMAQINAIVPNLARGIFGEVGVLTDNDIRIYSQTIPNLGSTSAVRDAVLSATIRTAVRGVEDFIKVQAGLGRDVSGLTTVYTDLVYASYSMLTQATGMTMLEGPDGKKYQERRLYSKQDLIEAIESGFRVNGL